MNLLLFLERNLQVEFLILSSSFTVILTLLLLLLKNQMKQTQENQKSLQLTNLTLMKLVDRQTAIIASKTPLEFQTIQLTPSLLTQTEPESSSTNSEIKSEDEEAFEEYVKGGDYDFQRDAY